MADTQTRGSGIILDDAEFHRRAIEVVEVLRGMSYAQALETLRAADKILGLACVVSPDDDRLRQALDIVAGRYDRDALQ